MILYLMRGPGHREGFILPRGTETAWPILLYWTQHRRGQPESGIELAFINLCWLRNSWLLHHPILISISQRTWWWPVAPERRRKQRGERCGRKVMGSWTPRSRATWWFRAQALETARWRSNPGSTSESCGLWPISSPLYALVSSSSKCG